MGGKIVKIAKGNYVENATNNINYYSGGDITTLAGQRINEKADEGIFLGEAEEAPKSEKFTPCEADDPPAAPSGMLGTCDYYKWRFENFMERHNNDSCKHNPPDYYYGPMREIEGGLGIIDTLKEWWTPTLEKEMEQEQVPEYERGHGTFKPIPSESYGYKYCVRFSKVLMPKLSEAGKNWLTEARRLLQDYMERGVVKKNYCAVFNESFNLTYDLPNESDAFYTKIEERNATFKGFAFATHPDAYLKAGLLSISLSDKMKVVMTPDFKEFATLDTWKQVFIVLEEQLKEWHQQASEGMLEIRRQFEAAVEEAEDYLNVFSDVPSLWERANRELEKYRDMPWLISK